MFDEDAREESSWTTPLRILIITLVLAGGFLYYYFGPTVDDLQGNTPVASPSTVPIELTVGGVKFSIPENFTQFPRVRHGGVRENVALYGMLPDLDPYTLATEVIFEANDAKSPIVHFQIESYRAPLSEPERFKRIYLPRLENPEGQPGPVGLTHYTFLAGTGYSEEDLYVERFDNGEMVVLRCTRQTSKLLYPNCRRDMRLTETVGLSYRFKRERLEEWKQIDRIIRDQVYAFMVKSEE